MEELKAELTAAMMDHSMVSLMAGQMEPRRAVEWAARLALSMVEQMALKLAVYLERLMGHKTGASLAVEKVG